MNRSILIVICDFLLISLLAFSSVDINKVAEEGAQSPVRAEVTATNTGQAARNDLAAVMQLALSEERRSREQLQAELERTRAAATDRETQARQLQQQLQSREQLAAQLERQLQQRQQEGAELQRRQETLQQQFASAQTNLQRLNEQLQNTSGQVSQTKEQLAQTEAEARRQSEQAAALQRQLAELARSNQMVLNERQQLATRLQVAEVERRHAMEQASAMQEQVKLEREEKARLAEGVKALANKSTELVQEIRENRPLAPNTIFSDFLSNRVEAAITGTRPGMFGNDSTRSRGTTTVLASDGTNTFAVCHVQDTPLVLYTPGAAWESLHGTLSRGSAQVPVRSLAFSFNDPRIVWIPLAEAEVRTLGSRAFRTSTDPYKFQDAVLVGANEGYYGECRFQIDSSAPDYVRLDHSFVRGLFGKFNPSRGDLVFSRTGELLGVMVNANYCMMIRAFDAGATLRFGGDVRAQRPAEMLSALHSQVTQLPLKLQ